MQKPILVNKDL
jgi:alpha-tubulin suppressor-like RCC1 family protein